MFENLMNGIHSFNLPFGGHYILISTQNLVTYAVMVIGAVIVIALVLKLLGALGRALFKK